MGLLRVRLTNPPPQAALWSAKWDDPLGLPTVGPIAAPLGDTITLQLPASPNNLYTGTLTIQLIDSMEVVVFTGTQNYPSTTPIPSGSLISYNYLTGVWSVEAAQGGPLLPLAIVGGIVVGGVLLAFMRRR